jgi:hypothetical protein
MHGAYRTVSGQAFHTAHLPRHGAPARHPSGEPQQHQEMIMRLAVLVAAQAVAIALLVASLPAEACYIAPELPWQLKVFCTRGC